MTAAHFAIPGDPATPTGGYVYDARVTAASGGALAPLPLPEGFPAPSEAELSAARAALMGVEGPIVIDGLAYGALPASLIEGLPRRPVALCHHPLGLEPGLTSIDAARLIASERAALALAAHTIVTSEATRRTLIADFGLAEAAVTVAPPGLDRAPPAAAYRKESAPAAITGAAPVILTVASLTPRKGHDTLIAALEVLKDRPWRCRLVGPDDRDGAWADGLRMQAAAAGLADRIEFSGAMSREGLDAAYGAADLFCLPSRYEGYGMVFDEAMMRALPVVACAAGAVPDVVPPAAGTLLPPDDPDALADALDDYLGDPAKRAAAGAAGRAHALTLPDWTATWEKIRMVLERFA